MQSSYGHCRLWCRVRANRYALRRIIQFDRTWLLWNGNSVPNRMLGVGQWDTRVPVEGTRRTRIRPPFHSPRALHLAMLLNRTKNLRTKVFCVLLHGFVVVVSSTNSPDSTAGKSRIMPGRFWSRLRVELAVPGTSCPRSCLQ